MEWILPLITIGMFGNNKFANYEFFGCLDDYERYEKKYKKYGSDK